MATKRTQSDIKKGNELSFSSPWHFSDVVLVVKKRKFHVHKSTLSMWSKVFETMFTSYFKEKEAKEIPLPGKSEKDILSLLEFMYDKKQEVNDDNLEIFLRFADEYQMEKLESLCKDYMMKILEKKTAFHIYALAVKFKLVSTFKEPCFKHLKYWPSNELLSNGHYQDLNDKEKIEVLVNRLMNMDNEMKSCWFKKEDWTMYVPMCGVQCRKCR